MSVVMNRTSKKYDRDNPPLYCSKCKSAAWDRGSNTRGTMFGGKTIDRIKNNNKNKK